MKIMFRIAAALTLLLPLVFALQTASGAEDQPLCTIAAISSPYVTTLSAKELGKRGWIDKVAPAGMEKTLAAVAATQPDALVMLGSLTWSGSEADYGRLAKYVARVKVPLYMVPGPRDVSEGGLERFKQRFAKYDVSDKSVRVKNVHLQFPTLSASPTGKESQQRLAWMEKDLAGARDARGVLVFGGPEYPAPTDPTDKTSPQARFWQMITREHVAARFTGGHAHTLRYLETLPLYSIPSSGWSYSPKWSLCLITVFPRQIELKLILDDGQPVQTLVIPNPVAAPRMASAKQDPYQLPSYSEDLARKPDLTFVQLSDSQFDDKTVPRYGARYKYDQQMNTLAVTQVNRLKPAMVFMTGDLTNKNTPTEWKTFERIYSKLKAPLHPLPGNHDTLYDRTRLDRDTLGDLLEAGQKNWQLADKLAGKPTDDRTTLYRHFMKREPYYTVEKNGCVFLCLNTGVADVDSEQMKWLRGELERTKDAAHVFVLGHYPVLKDFGGNVQGEAGEEIMSLLRQYKVAAYLSGHRHRYGYRMHNGTTHVLCNCLCWGEYLSYQIYHVFPDHIVACWKPIFRADGNRPLYERVLIPEPRHR